MPYTDSLRPDKTVKYQLGIFSLLLALNFLFLLVFYISNIFTGFGFNESVIFHIFYGIQGFDMSLYLNHIIVVLIFSASVIYLCFKWPIRYLPRLPFKNVLNVLLLAVLWFQPLTNNLFTLFGSSVFNRSFIGELHPVIHEYIFVPSDKNLVVIYAESFEATLMDETLYPGLAPNLNKLAKQGLSFTNLSQTYGAASTTAGMVASQCGVPFDFKGIADQDQPFLPSLYCLGDILSDNNYFLSYMGGASLKFAGKGNFYRSHSFDRVRGKIVLSELLSDKTYINKWGLYDDFLLRQALIEFNQLAYSKEKFALFLLTLDTHVPDNFASDSCEGIAYQNGSDDALNTLHCSDLLIGRFVNSIRNSAWAKDTIIVIASDHLSPDSDIFKDKIERNQRRNMLIVLGDEIEAAQNNNYGSTLDIAPTLLNILGSDISSLNLGVSLLKDKKGLIATDDQINQKLMGWTHQLRKFN